MSVFDDRVDLDMIDATARELFDNAGGVQRARALRDGGTTTGRGGLWSSMTELGWAGVALPEEFGGAGLGMRAVLPLFEHAGRVLAPEPLLGSFVGGQIILLAGSPVQRREWLPGIAAGKLVVVAALDPLRSPGPGAEVLSVVPTANGMRVSGRQGLTLDAASADAAVVIDSADPGRAVIVDVGRHARTTPRHLIDSRMWAAIEVADTDVPLERLLVAGAGLEAALDRATLALCADMLGAMWEAFDRTLEYTKHRVQFGRTIGSFQAVQHRLARLYTRVAEVDALVHGAAAALDAGEEPAAQVSMAKIRCIQASRDVRREAIQFHGGIGVTDDCDIGLFVKRLRVAEFMFGDEAWHLDRWATLAGY